ncbi:MAG: hypothetical protein IJ395_02765 [Clostridia bacterium]|nr:hypothetical protein [Clostridia bacterium]
MCFAVGGFAYGLTEIIFRGYTHWTMVLLGGAVMVLLNLINQSKISLWMRCLLGATVITSLEYSVGMIVNVALGWNVWDYSDKFLNLKGQICPQFSLVWFFLCIPAYWVCEKIGEHFSSVRYSS